MIQKAERNVIPRSPYPGLPVGTVVIEDGPLVLVDVDSDGDPDISHDRRDGRTLIHYSGTWPGGDIAPTVMRDCGVFRHRFDGTGAIEVNLIPELPPFVSASRNALTPELEEVLEVCHAARYRGFFGPLGSPCSRLDWNGMPEVR